MNFKKCKPLLYYICLIFKINFLFQGLFFLCLILYPGYQSLMDANNARDKRKIRKLILNNKKSKVVSTSSTVPISTTSRSLNTNENGNHFNLLPFLHFF